MAGKYICPYCYKESKMSEVDFRCTNKQCTGEENDEKLAAYMGQASVVTLKAFSSKKKGLGIKMPEYAECPVCGVTTGIRLCPYCHNPLPQATTDGNDMIISIIGARDSGKSNYVGVLTHELQYRVSNKFDFSFGMIKESNEQYKERFGRWLYPEQYGQRSGAGQAHTVPRTEAHIKGRTITMSPPIVCELGKRIGKKIERYSLSFLDSAGEDFEDPVAMSTVMPYIAHSKGIIFLLDPMQIPNVRNQLAASVVQQCSSTQIGEVISHGDVISNVAELIRTNKKMKKGKVIDIPVVVAFSKFDALKSIVDSSDKLWKDSPHADLGAFDCIDLQMVSEEMIGLLSMWGLADFIDKVKTEFSNVVYLPCSAFGSCPDVSHNVAPPKSLRLEDGVLWIMKELNMIPVKK